MFCNYGIMLAPYIDSNVEQGQTATSLPAIKPLTPLGPQRNACLLQGDARRGKGSVEELRLAHNDHTPLTGKLEVGGHDAGVDLAEKLAGSIPDVDAVVGAGVNVSL